MWTMPKYDFAVDPVVEGHPFEASEDPHPGGGGGFSELLPMHKSRSHPFHQCWARLAVENATCAAHAASATWSYGAPQTNLIHRPHSQSRHLPPHAHASFLRG